MGVVCRHEFPLCFINLFHGERYMNQYAVLLRFAVVVLNFQDIILYALSLSS